MDVEVVVGEEAAEDVDEGAEIYTLAPTAQSSGVNYPLMIKNEFKKAGQNLPSNVVRLLQTLIVESQRLLSQLIKMLNQH